jgi:BirA family transcriptional regulator, biotin operon repressor / biotin---[acetyl-CoA-carboxylase] ligase
MIQFSIGKYDRINSTNIFLNNLTVSSNCDEGLVVSSENQTHGRGYGKNIWESEPKKNLLFSVLLKPDFLSAENQFYLSMVVSLALYRTIEKIIGTKKLKIKWPNDIYYENKKMAGILIENTIAGLSISKSIIGVGLNVNQTTFSKEIPNPISIKNIIGIETEKDQILDIFLNNLNMFYLDLQNNKMDIIKTAYLENLYQKGIEAQYKIDKQIIKGTIIGIDKFGQLEIQINNKIEIFGFKEIEYLNDIQNANPL